MRENLRLEMIKTYKELKSFCDERIKEFPKYEKKYKKEIIVAKRFYDNDRNLFEELNENKSKLSKRYIIPFLLELTNEVINLPPEYIQVRPGAGSQIDIDSDFSPKTKEAIQEYLVNKYGEDRVFHVGTFSRLGIASAAKDLLRVYKIDFKESNSFTRVLDSDHDWEWNLKSLKENFPEQYAFYEENKEILDMVPSFVNKIRSTGAHAGGIVILDRPVYELVPVDRVGGKLSTAFPESNQEGILDSLGVVKFDILAISILDVISDTIDLIDEKIFLVLEDGMEKIVSESYLNERIEEF